MYPNIRIPQKINVVKINFKPADLCRFSFTLALFFCVITGSFEIVFAQEISSSEDAALNNPAPELEGIKTGSEADNKPTPATGTRVSLPNDTFASNLAFPGNVSPEEAKSMRKAMTLITQISQNSNPATKQQSASELYFHEQKKKARKKHEQEMKIFNARNKKLILANFNRFQKLRQQSANSSGRHYDFTAYNQNFQSRANR
ncbi:MAG: hypothetical protein H8E38_13780 [SAR324 cluster bacterium]|nr:hypothetical protein [SAR324 cluster bacterium]MBL7035881.1 hypothetical protein [SAR324 cluster bacterium]